MTEHQRPPLRTQCREYLRPPPVLKVQLSLGELPSAQPVPPRGGPAPYLLLAEACPQRFGTIEDQREVGISAEHAESMRERGLAQQGWERALWMA
jgi:hypothetical protein